MSMLVAIVGAEDPFAAVGPSGHSMHGPILTAARLGSFARVVLVHDRARARAAEDTAAALAGATPPLPAQAEEWVAGPDDRVETRAAALAAVLQRVQDGATPSVLLPAGDALDRAAVMLLSACGRLPGRLLEIRPPRFPGDTPAALHVLEPASRPDAWLARDPAAAYGLAPSPHRASDRALEAACHELGLEGEDAGYRRAVDTAASVAAYPVPALILGETGTGKGMLARLIHRLSDRAHGPFVAVNCAALPENLVESLLFGHRRGAFTGALSDQPGKFERAHGGTLFLDEIGELPLTLQPKLLRALEDRTIEPLGAAAPRAVDVRIVAATHRDPRRMVAEKTFREDLYYRLGYAVIHLPALRDRRGDIAALSLHLLDRLNRSLRRPLSLTPPALRRLEGHPWPGNIRELENVLGRSALLATGDRLEAADLLLEPPLGDASAGRALPEPAEGFSLEAFLSDARRALILRALEKTGGRQAAAARLLGISPQAVHKFLHAASAGRASGDQTPASP